MHLNFSDLDRACKELSATGENLSTTFEGFFSCLMTIRTRTMRLRGDVVAAVDRQNGAPIDFAAQGHLTNLQTSLGRLQELNSGRSGEAKAQIEQLINQTLDHHQRLVDAAFEPSAPNGSWLDAMADGLKKVASLPMTRLVSSAQIRDSLEQRLSHVLEGFELLHSASEQAQPRMGRILSAQTKSIADTILEVSQSSLRSCESLADSLSDAQDQIPDFRNEINAVVATVKEIDGLSENGEDQDLSNAVVAVRSAISVLNDEFGDFINGCESVQAEARTALSNVSAEIMKMKAFVSELADHASSISDTAAVIRSASETHHDGMAPPALFADLQKLYTSEVEHAVHEAEFQRGSLPN